MSLIRFEGFEESTTLSDYFTSGNAAISSTQPRTGSQSLNCSNTTATAQCTAGQEDATHFHGFGLYHNGQFELRMQSDSAATTHITVVVLANGGIEVRRGSASGALLGTALAAGTFPTGAYKHLGVKVKLHDTTGTVDVWLDGVLTSYSLTGQDTKNAGTKTTFDSVTFFHAAGSQGYVDDWYWLNGDGTSPNSFLGDQKVVTLMPNGDGATTQFSLSTGSSHYQLVDEKPRNTTDYVYDTVNGHIDLFDFENLPAGSQNVSAIQVELYANRSDAGTTMKFERAVRSGGTNYFGADIALGTSFVYLAESGAKIVLVNDPATSAAWATSAVDSVQVGVKLITP